MLAICCTILSSDAGQCLKLPVSHAVMCIDKGNTYNHSVPVQPFCSSLSVKYSMNYMSYSTPFKIGFLLGDFAQVYTKGMLG